MNRLVTCIIAFGLGLGLAADKTGTAEPRAPALLGIVPAPAPRGVIIHQVLKDSAAERSGLKVGDVILSVNGMPMRSPQEMVAYIRRHFAGTIVSIEYVQDGKTKTQQIALGERLETSSLAGRVAPKIILPIFEKLGKFSIEPGKIYIIDFWASWCGACEPVRRTLEELKSDKKNSGIDVIGITTEDAATIRAFYGQKNPPYPILIDAANEVTMSFHVAGYPTLAVVDGKGIVRFAGFASGGGFDTAIGLARRLAGNTQP